jgi:NAD(P)-dependent dehydrogenase (short-subunit alcohol dehydrogenase family)
VSDPAGRRALVTGGAVRLGRALSLACADLGMDVGIHFHRSAGPAESTAEACRARGVAAVTLRGDLETAGDCHRLAARAEEALGGVDALVASASNFIPGALAEVDETTFDRVLALNLKAPFFLAQALAPGMAARGYGRIVNLADVAGLEPWPRFIAHCVSKAGLVMLTRALAQALAPEILVNAIAPGPVLMPEGSTPEQVERSAAKTVLGRIGSPEDAAGALRYILTADYVTGHVLVVDGGRMVRP